jgi:RNA polymerase sigma factor (sigma-70 family)
MTPAEYINKHYSDIKEWLRGVTMNEYQHLYDDFIHELLIIFIEHPQAQQAVDTNTVRYFLTRIALNQWRSNNSPFYIKYKKHLMHNEMIDNQPSTEFNGEDDAIISELIRVLDTMYQSNKRYEAYVIILYHTLNNSYAQVGRYLNMPPTTVRKIYLRGIKILKKQINGNNINSFNQWDIHSSIAAQSSLSVVSQLFKTRYFEQSVK